MSRMCVALLAVLLINTVPASAQEGQDWSDCDVCTSWGTPNWAHRCHLIIERNKAWPYPFIEPDRMAVEAPFQVMVNNGWRRQNLMSSYHFDGNELNEAGRIKTGWVLSSSPPSRRTLFVQHGRSPEDTRARVQSVQKWTQQVRPNEHIAVVVSNLTPQGVPGEYMDLIYRKSTDTIPDPRIPPASAAIGGQ